MHMKAAFNQRSTILSLLRRFEKLALAYQNCNSWLAEKNKVINTCAIFSVAHQFTTHEQSEMNSTKCVVCPHLL